MAIRYDSEYNARLAREVRNYNKRRNRAVKRGFTNLPPTVKVSDLKARYTSRSDLERELNVLRQFRQKGLLEKIENRGGVKAISWEFENLKANIQAMKKYFSREYERVSKRVGRFPGERTYLDNIQAKIGILNLDVDYMSQQQFRSAKAILSEFTTSAEVRKSQYRGFLSEIDWLMEKLGTPEKRKNEFFKKFEQLTPQQFLYVYDNNDIIAKVYSLYRKGGDGDTYITDEDNAEDLLDELMDEADDMVNDAKLNAD